MIQAGFAATILACSLWSEMAKAQDRMTIEGNNLIYDTNAVWAADNDTSSIINSDANNFVEIEG